MPSLTGKSALEEPAPSKIASAPETKLPPPAPPAEGEESSDDEINGWVDLLGSGGILKKTIKKGTPNTRPVRLQRCILNYKLSLKEDGPMIERKHNFQIHMGDNEVVQGLDLGLGLMDQGERCLFKIQPRLAFGELGWLPLVPPDSWVVYEVELVAVGEEDQMEKLPIMERKRQGNKKKERGNWWYGRGDHSTALQLYRRALDYLDEVEGGITQPTIKEDQEEVTDSTLQSLLEDRISVCNNMAAAQIKLELYEAALTSLQTVLRCQPDNVKALFRRAKAHQGKNEPVAAMTALKRAAELSPGDPTIEREMALTQKVIVKQKNVERDLARKMFRGSSSVGDSDSVKGSKKSRGKSKSSMLIWGSTAAVSLAVGLIGIVAYKFRFS